MKRLIVNADDLGADEARNAGIFEAVRAGCVTSASLLANAPALGDALSRAGSLNPATVSFGVHINLSEGRPVSCGLKILAGRDGLFRGKLQTRELLMGAPDPDLTQEITREVAAQIDTLLDAGVRIDHLDGHQHVHILPAAVAPVTEAARRYGIPWIRFPVEPSPEPQSDSLPGLAQEARLFSETAAASREHLNGAGLRTTDHFRGLSLKGKLSSSTLKTLLYSLPEGLTELMVHPGRVPRFPSLTPFSGFSTSDRERELEALLDEAFHSILSEAGIALTSFPEVHH